MKPTDTRQLARLRAKNQRLTIALVQAAMTLRSVTLENRRLKARLAKWGRPSNAYRALRLNAGNVLELLPVERIGNGN